MADKLGNILLNDKRSEERTTTKNHKKATKRKTREKHTHIMKWKEANKIVRKRDTRYIGTGDDKDIKLFRIKITNEVTKRIEKKNSNKLHTKKSHIRMVQKERD